MRESRKQQCLFCVALRLLVVAILCGAAAGYLTLRLGLDQELSMAATFIAALLPLMWLGRLMSRRSDQPDDRDDNDDQ